MVAFYDKITPLVTQTNVSKKSIFENEFNAKSATNGHA